MKREIMEKSRGDVKVYVLMVPNIDVAKETSIIRKKLEDAISTYEASNNMLYSAATINSSVFKDAIEAMLKNNEHKTVQVNNASSTVAYRVELEVGKTTQYNATYYSVYADFYKYEEA